MGISSFSRIRSPHESLAFIRKSNKPTVNSVNIECRLYHRITNMLDRREEILVSESYLSTDVQYFVCPMET